MHTLRVPSFVVIISQLSPAAEKGFSKENWPNLSTNNVICLAMLKCLQIQTHSLCRGVQLLTFYARIGGSFETTKAVQKAISIAVGVDLAAWPRQGLQLALVTRMLEDAFPLRQPAGPHYPISARQQRWLHEKLSLKTCFLKPGNTNQIHPRIEHPHSKSALHSPLASIQRQEARRRLKISCMPFQLGL